MNFGHGLLSGLRVKVKKYEKKLKLKSKKQQPFKGLSLLCMA